jgi:broad specificity phosphatase PhoE
MIVDLIRHGEPVGGRRYRGQTDDPLSDKGWQQMWAAVAGQHSWQVVVTSTLSRCREFAWALGKSLGLDVHEDPRFKEIGFGEWEGRTAAELTRDAPERLLKFFNDPVSYSPRGAEPLAEFNARVTGGWDSVVQKYDGKHVLIVAHAGVIRAVVAHVLGMPIEHLFRLQVGNAAISRIQIDAGRAPVLQLYNGRL